MNTYADKTQKKNESVVGVDFQMQSGRSAFQFVDNRPETVMQRKLKAMANNYSARQLRPIQKRENTNKPIQRIGNAPYRREIGIQTNYLSMRVRHPDAGNQKPETEAGNYIVRSIRAQGNRPPTYLNGHQMQDQGQHKIAWIGIWKGLQRFEGESVDTAHITMTDINAISGMANNTTQPNNMQVVGNYSSPPLIDRLMSRSHNYLIARQAENPSWVPRGTQAERQQQLDGKGEGSLNNVLTRWQSFDSEEFEDADDLRGWLNEVEMDKLFDKTGRFGGEITDVRQRAKRELRLHNPVLYVAIQADLEAWVNSKL